MSSSEKHRNNSNIEEAYAKAVLFDYSYRYFYEDGYGKDYRIFNIPNSQANIEFLYLSACLLGFYQQLRLYRERKASFVPYNIEKPLWVFVGSSVSKASFGRSPAINRWWPSLNRMAFHMRGRSIPRCSFTR